MVLPGWRILSIFIIKFFSQIKANDFYCKTTQIEDKTTRASTYQHRLIKEQSDYAAHISTVCNEEGIFFCLSIIHQISPHFRTCLHADLSKIKSEREDNAINTRRALTHRTWKEKFENLIDCDSDERIRHLPFGKKTILDLTPKYDTKGYVCCYWPFSQTPKCSGFSLFSTSLSRSSPAHVLQKFKTWKETSSDFCIFEASQLKKGNCYKRNIA